MSEIELGETFQVCADKMMLGMGFIASLPLEKMVETISMAHTLGPFVDPTKYRDALYKGDMDETARLAQALIEPVKIYNEILVKHGLNPVEV